MCVHATWTQKLRRATICSPRTAGAAVAAALIRQARPRVRLRPARRPRCPRHRIHRPRYQSCARIQELFLEEDVRLLRVVQAAAPPSRTTCQSTRQAHRPWHRVSPTDARASAVPSSATTAEDFVAAAFIIHQRFPFHPRLPCRRRRRHRSASSGATRAATTGTRSILAASPFRNTAAAAVVQLSSRTSASRAVPMAPVTPLLRHHPRCHHRPAQSRPRRPTRRPRRPHPFSRTSAKTIRLWVLRSEVARPPLRLEAVIAILTTPHRAWWWASSSKTVRSAVDAAIPTLGSPTGHPRSRHHPDLRHIRQLQDNRRRQRRRRRRLRCARTRAPSLEAGARYSRLADSTATARLARSLATTAGACVTVAAVHQAHHQCHRPRLHRRRRLLRHRHQRRRRPARRPRVRTRAPSPAADAR